MYHILADKGKRIISDRDLEKESRREGKIARKKVSIRDQTRLDLSHAMPCLPS